jgi:hypothetical protein
MICRMDKQKNPAHCPTGTSIPSAEQENLSRNSFRRPRNVNKMKTVLHVIMRDGSHQNPSLRDPGRDKRQYYIDAFGIWTFMAKIVRLHNKPGLEQFLPHVNLLNEGAVGQNKPLEACEDATNKIFELLFALILLDIGTDLALDHPHEPKGDNPDILVTLDNQRWGFACKTVYGKSAKTFFDNLKKGVEQIEDSSAEIGCVVANFRNLIQHDQFRPVKRGPDGALQFGSIKPEERDLVPLVLKNMVAAKQEDLGKEIGVPEVMAIFAQKKCIPGFLAYCQTAAGLASSAGVVIPSSILVLTLAEFGNPQKHNAVFSEINEALHERRKS